MDSNPHGDIILTPDELSELRDLTGHESRGIPAGDIRDILGGLVMHAEILEAQWLQQPAGERNPNLASESRRSQKFAEKIAQVAGFDLIEQEVK